MALRSGDAPWAEPVLFTADDLMALPDDARRYELVHGRFVQMSPTGLEHSNVAGNLYVALRSFVVSRGLGHVTMPETGFLISSVGEPDTVLAPDLAFVSASRVPKPSSAAWRKFPRLAPELVVEIAAPGQHRPEMAVKARMWLSAGTPLVWIVWPAAHEADVWRAGSTEPTILGKTDELRGEDVLPGFSYPVCRLFE